MAEIGIILGSDSDLPKIKECLSIFEKFGVSFDLIISSAHRTPDQTMEWVKNAGQKGIKIIIAAAGGAAHLPGVVASHTTIPVIGIPIETKISGGLDSILSILQMPAGIPVATMPAGKSGGSNAALFAINILAIENKTFQNKLIDYRKNMIEKIKKKNDNIKSMGYEKYIKSLEEKK